MVINVFMIIGILTVDLLIPSASSLKEKRRVIKSLKERLKNSFNISIIEDGYHDKWQRAKIAIANLNIDRRATESQLSKIENFIEGFQNVQILNRRAELI